MIKQRPAWMPEMVKPMGKYDDEERTDRICEYCHSTFVTRRGVVVASCYCDNYEPGGLYY